MVKILYLLVGITLKQAVDEIEAVANDYRNRLEKDREGVAAYRPNQAIEAGSPDDFRIRAEHEHPARVEPQLKRLDLRIRLVRFVPLVLYVLATIGLFVWIAILEARSP